MVGDLVRAEGREYIVVWNGGPLLPEQVTLRTIESSKTERNAARATWKRRAETGKHRGPARFEVGP